MQPGIDTLAVCHLVIVLHRVRVANHHRLFSGERRHHKVVLKYNFLIARVAKKELTVVIDSTFPLSDAEGAHRHIESRKAFGRVLLIP